MASETSPVRDFIQWTTGRTEHPFYHYEPYDGPDGLPPHHTPGGSRFQLSGMRSTKYIRMYIAGNRSGKSYDRGIESVIMLTGELPYCFRYEIGVDTGIKRVISDLNIRRWGRRSTLTKEVLDHNESAAPDPTWDCGTIIGVGDYPREKICTEKNGQIWISTYRQARDDNWIDALKSAIPEHCLDKSKGTNGYSVGDCIFYLTGGASIRLKTYDQGWEKVEAKKAWHIVLDEEPPDRRYYTGCVMHAFSLSLSFTPLRGMDWSYTDLYEPWLNGNRNQDIEVFHATKYDSPYSIKAEVEREERQLKPWERESKIYGRFSQQEGRPYYDWELCRKYVSEYAPNYKLTCIYPVGTVRSVEAAMKQVMITRPATEHSPDTWEIYELPRKNCAYWLTADCGKGHDDPAQAQDKSSTYIFRAPLQDKNENMEFPVCVAALHTTEVVENFAWLCLYAAIFYNYALIVPEVKGEDGSSFFVELRDYPFWFRMTVISDRTKKTVEKIGFDTNARTRTPLFNKLRKYINEHEGKSNIPHLPLLIEQSKIIWLNGRPDHPPGGTSDCVVAWCLGLWVWYESRFQIADNSKRFRIATQTEGNPGDNLMLTYGPKYETRPILGSTRGLDARRRGAVCQEKSQSLKELRQQRMDDHQTFKKSKIF